MRNLPRNKPALIAGVIILLFVSISALATFFLVKHEKQRDYRDWELFLNAKATAKARTITNWLAQQLEVVSMLSQNTSLQHYTRESGRPGVSPEIKQSQIIFLRNLIHTTANRHGFISQPPTNIKANIPIKSLNGLAIIGSDFEFIIGTPGFDYQKTLLQRSITDLTTLTKPVITKVRKGKNNSAIVGFLAPIKSQKTIQAGSGRVIGAIYGYKSIQPLLTEMNAGAIKSSSEEMLLIFKDDNSISNITPLADGTAPFMMKQPLNTLSATSHALKNPGTFNILTDYQGQEVFFISKTIDHTPWVLLEKIETKEALAESRNHQRFLITSLGLATFLIAALLAASWWYVSYIKKQALAKDLRKQNSLLAVKTHLLDSINDNIKDLLLLVNNQGQCLFISGLFARKLSSYPNEIQGQLLQSFLGRDLSLIFDNFISQAFEQKKSIITPLSLALDSGEYYFHGTFTPIHYTNAVGEFDAVLITLHDLTALKSAEERENNLLQQLITTLMSAIDRHDPYSANHSSKTAHIAVLVAKAMNMSSPEIEALHIAASLCNLGKLSIDKSVLTKKDKLTDEELRSIRLETQHAYDLLKEIEFDGPVKETIVQKHEHLDGSGHPYGITGETIIPTARILAAVNAFVAIISPRAYRERLTPQAGMEVLMKDVDAIYDRKVLAALFQVVENEIDWDSWGA